MSLTQRTADTIHFSFEEIENILSDPLPASARKYDVWWNPAGHPHAEGWEELGWTAEPNLDDETVTFDNIS